MLIAAGAAYAQDDERDCVTLASGRVVRGRVATPYAAEELLVVTGGKRTRIPVGDVRGLDTVAANVAAFFERRLRHRDSARALRYLVDWAVQHDLPGLARLQATAFQRGVQAEKAAAKERRGAKRVARAVQRRKKTAAARFGRRRRAAQM